MPISREPDRVRPDLAASNDEVDPVPRRRPTTRPPRRRRLTKRGRDGRPVLTGRAMVLGAVLVLLIVVLASPISRFLGSRSGVSSAAAQLREDRSTLAQLTRQKALYSDPGYIQQRARATLQYAMPGDVVYTVVGKGAENSIEQTRGAGAKSGPATKAWNTKLWDSVRSADG